MGGIGSGRSRGFGARETDFAALDIRQCRVSVCAGGLAFAYTHRGERHTCQVDLDWTPCHFGGRRPWFRCPECGRRAGRLYGGGRFVCRKCAGFRYESQYDPLGGAASRFQRTRERLQRKGLHWNTRQRLEARLALDGAKVNAYIGQLWRQAESLAMGLNRRKGR